VIASVAACGSDLNVGPPPQQQQLGVPVAWTASTRNTAGFEMGVEQISAHGGANAAYLHGPALNSFVAFQQQIDATPFRGKRVKASVWVTESFLTNAGAFGVAVDAPDNQASSSIEIPAPVGGSDTWHQVFVVFDVPDNTVGLTLAGSMTGSGQVFFDDVALEVVTDETPLTTSAKARTSADSLTLVATYAGANATLLNGDFEAGIGALLQ
jgi:hypothetical protein